MSNWQPISLESLNSEIRNAEPELKGILRDFWQLIKILPEKWAEEKYGKEGCGFWVVAICGKKIVWFNDIEEGFNVSYYKEYGQIEEYSCNQDELVLSVKKLFDSTK